MVCSPDLIETCLRCVFIFDRCWNQERKKKNPKFWRALARAFASKFLLPFFAYMFVVSAAHGNRSGFEILEEENSKFLRKEEDSKCQLAITLESFPRF